MVQYDILYSYVITKSDDSYFKIIQKLKRNLSKAENTSPVALQICPTHERIRGEMN